MVYANDRNVMLKLHWPLLLQQKLFIFVNLYHHIFMADLIIRCITKTRLFKYIEISPPKTESFQIKKF